MKFRSLAASVALTALAVGFAGPVRAGDPPKPAASAPDLDKSLAAAKSMLDDERWADAEAALRRVFVDFPNDARVRAKLRGIEDDLKISVFRRTLPPPKAADFLGDAVKRWIPSTREVELEFGGVKGPQWDVVESFSVLKVRFDGTLTLEAKLDYLDSNRRTAVFVLCYDLEKRGGYAVTPGISVVTREAIQTAPAKIVKLGAAGDKELFSQIPYGADFPDLLTISRSGGEIVAKVGKSVVAHAGDAAYSSGYVGVSSGGLRSLKIKGRIDKHAWRKLVAERCATQFAEWEKASWNREKEIPEWARAAVAAERDETLVALPADAPGAEFDELCEVAQSLAAGDLAVAAKTLVTARKKPRRTRLYLVGLAELALGGFKSAEATFDELVAAEPDFVPARLFRGAARVRLRRVEEARADLEWALAQRPSAVDALVSIADLAMIEGDLARADAVLSKAAETSAADVRLDEMRDWVHRCVKGPRLAQRFEHETEHFVVVSDHSKKVCFDTAALLESMQTRYAEAVGAAKGKVPKERVYVLSGQKGYMDYAAGLHARADSTAGVYLPMLRELVIWIPLDMTSFTDTVRHEGFHQYLHRLVDDAPIWFNEGYASVLGGGGPEGLRNAARDAELVKRFVPVKDLVAMRQPAFMRTADVTYTESRYLVDFLRRTKSEKLRTVLRDYFAAVSEGLSQDEVNTKILDPVMDVLEAEFKKSL